MQIADFFFMLTRWIFLIALGYYIIVNLQWYHYKISRVIFKHHKLKWHVFYFLLPIVYFVCIPENAYFYSLLYAYVIALLIWIFNLSKKLIFTGRILRFFSIYFAFIVFNDVLLLNNDDHTNPLLSQIIYLLPLVIAIFLSSLLEKILLNRYKKLAQEKLASMPNLTIIAVSGSYGKTSLKNFIAQILYDDFKVYTTPRSVNTLAGIIADINQNLSSLAEIYIVEAGARGLGHIKEIVELINPQIAIIGKIGNAHIEYFKNLQTIHQAKYELLESDRLYKVYIYEKNDPPAHCYAPISYFPNQASKIHADLDGTSFTLTINNKKIHFQTQILGAFNVINLSAAIAVAYDLGVNIEKIQKQVQKIQPTNHRLTKINVNNKIILDDSYNGNLDGMLEAIRLSSLHPGNKIIVTPGLIESDEQSNIALAKAIDEIFDIAIITGELNSNLLKNHIHKPQKIILKDKTKIENILKCTSHEGDLILFANDAPSYI